MKDTLTILSSVLLVGFVSFKTLSKKTDIYFDKKDKDIEIKRDFYEEQLDKISRELVDDILKSVTLDLMNEDNVSSISYDVCSNCSSSFSFSNVVVD